VSSPQTLTATVTDIELARKETMHSAAERAKIRRQREEEEREKERERARKKAAELEEKIKASEKGHDEKLAAAQVSSLNKCRRSSLNEVCRKRRQSPCLHIHRLIDKPSLDRHP